MRKIQGMSLVGMLFTAFVVIVLGVMTMRIIPVYLENYRITKSIDNLSDLPADTWNTDDFSNAQILKNSLTKQLDVNSIDIKKLKKLSVNPTGDKKYSISYNYKAIKPLIGNIYLLFDFKETKEVKIDSP